MTHSCSIFHVLGRPSPTFDHFLISRIHPIADFTCIQYSADDHSSDFSLSSLRIIPCPLEHFFAQGMATHSLAIVRSPSPIPIPPISLAYPRSPSPPPIRKRLEDHDKIEHDEDNEDSSSEPVPIPWGSYFPVLCFCIADAMSYSVIFPFITDMVTSFNVPSDKIGLYSGLGEGVMMLVEAANATNWAKLGDKYGRRPCILIGFSVTVLGLPILAFSSSVTQIVLARAISMFLRILFSADIVLSGVEPRWCACQDTSWGTRASDESRSHLFHHVPILLMRVSHRNFSRWRVGSFLRKITVVAWRH